MDEVRGGIHLVVAGQKDTFSEYYLSAIHSYEQMMKDIQTAVLNGMTTLHITKDGIDMGKAQCQQLNVTSEI